MTAPRLRTVLIGFGKIGAGYADDPRMARYYPYATHAQVLASHPAFAWEAVVDVADEALALARERWRIPHTAKSAEELMARYQPEVAVLATPPQERCAFVEQLPTVRAVLVEKPLGVNVTAGEAFLARCRRRGVLVQVNLWRRADATFRELTTSALHDLVGTPQAVFGVYGNGLANNGTHMVDFVRMLLGDIAAVQAVGGTVPYAAGPVPGDVNVPFSMRLCSGLVVMMQPVRFEHYRENSLDIWGKKARLSIMQEGLSIFVCPRRANRAMQDAGEIASDQPRPLPSTVGEAFFHVYDNLAAAVSRGDALWSPGESALQTASVLEAVLRSAEDNGRPVEVPCLAAGSRN